MIILMKPLFCIINKYGLKTMLNRYIMYLFVKFIMYLYVNGYIMDSLAYRDIMDPLAYGDIIDLG